MAATQEADDALPVSIRRDAVGWMSPSPDTQVESPKLLSPPVDTFGSKAADHSPAPQSPVSSAQGAPLPPPRRRASSATSAASSEFSVPDFESPQPAAVAAVPSAAQASTSDESDSSSVHGSAHQQPSPRGSVASSGWGGSIQGGAAEGAQASPPPRGASTPSSSDNGGGDAWLDAEAPGPLPNVGSFALSVRTHVTSASSLDAADAEYMTGAVPTPRTGLHTVYATGRADTVQDIVGRVREHRVSASAHTQGSKPASVRPASASPVMQQAETRRGADRIAMHSRAAGASRGGGGVGLAAYSESESVDGGYEEAGIPDIDEESDASDEEERVLYRAGSFKRSWVADAASKAPPYAGGGSLTASAIASLLPGDDLMPSPQRAWRPHSAVTGSSDPSGVSARGMPVPPSSGAQRHPAAGRRIVATRSFRLPRPAPNVQGGGQSQQPLWASGGRPMSAPHRSGRDTQAWQEEDGESASVYSSTLRRAAQPARRHLPTPSFYPAPLPRSLPSLGQVRPLLRKVIMPLLTALKQHAQLWRTSVLPGLLPPDEASRQQAQQEEIEESLADTTAPIQQGILSSLHQLTAMSAMGLQQGEAPVEGGAPFLPLAMFARLTCHTYNKMALAAIQEAESDDSDSRSQALFAAHVFLSAAEDCVRVYLSQFTPLSLGQFLGAWGVLGTAGTDLALLAPHAAAQHIAAMSGGRYRPPSAASGGSKGGRLEAARLMADSLTAALDRKGIALHSLPCLHSEFHGSVAALCKGLYEAARTMQSCAHTAQEEPFFPGALAALAVTYNNLGVLLHSQGLRDRAMSSFQRGLAVEMTQQYLSAAAVGRVQSTALQVSLPPHSQSARNIASLYRSAADELSPPDKVSRPQAAPAHNPWAGPAAPQQQQQRPLHDTSWGRGVHRPLTVSDLMSERPPSPSPELQGGPRPQLSQQALVHQHAVSVGRQRMADALFGGGMDSSDDEAGMRVRQRPQAPASKAPRHHVPSVRERLAFSAASYPATY